MQDNILLDKIEKRLESIIESDQRTMSKRFHDGEDGRYQDGYYDGIYKALKIIKEES